MIQIANGFRRIITLTAAVVFGATAVTAAEFVGDLRMGSVTQSITGRLMVKDSVYRMDLSTRSGQYIVTVDQKTNESRLLDPATKTYREIPTLSPQSLQNDPFQALRYGDSIGVREFRGTDTVGPWICDRYAIRIKGNPVMVEWVARELEWPIRIKNLMATDSAFVELVNIEVGPLDSTVFMIPDGYAPEGEEAQQAAPEIGIRGGQQQSVMVDPARSVEIGLVNLAGGESTCIVELNNAGTLMAETAIGSVASRTFTFSGVGDQTRRIYSAGADQVVVRVISGEITVEVTQPE